METSEFERAWALNPEWHKAGKVHDWRNHVPDFVKKAWLQFSDDQKVLLFRWANELAGDEEWE